MEKDERQIAEWYNNLSSSYDELYSEEQSRKHKTVLEFLGDRHFRVLIDIGCGTGTFLNQAQENYDQGIGVDLSARMLEIAKKRKLPNADYVLASSSALPLKNTSSDCTVSVSTAKAEPNLSSFIADVERIARADSLLAITLFHQQGLTNPMSALGPKQSIRISERETLYFLCPGKRPEIAAESKNGFVDFKN